MSILSILIVNYRSERQLAICLDSLADCCIDLDYEKGYANRDAQINWSHLDIWVKYKENLLNDLNILNESAKNKDIEIINLIEDAWYGVFNGGNLKTNEL